MKLTFLGHASWLIQTEKTAVVCDLLVEDDFRNGTFTICPTRAFDLARMPRLDAAIITHRHRDHFDLNTLATLPRSTTILCPRDKIILHALERFGYERVVTFSDWSSHAVGDLTFIFTPSDNRVPENGVLVADSETVFWNHVDTVISASTIAVLRENLEAIHLVAHGYQPMLETAALEGFAMQFPSDMYAGLLHRARLLAPRAIVPGSNGYRTTGPQAWFNAYKFPVSRERFVKDIAAILPETQTFIQDPGDVLELRSQGGLRFERQGAASFVRTVTQDARALMAFDPNAEKPQLLDFNPRGTPLDKLRATVQTLFEQRIPEGSKRHVPPGSPLRTTGALFECRVRYPDRSLEAWFVEFCGPTPKVRRGDPGDESDLVMEIGASSLYDLATGHTRPDIIALSGQFRQFTRNYRIEGGRLLRPFEVAPPGIHHARAGFPWLLFTLVGHEVDFEARQVEAEADRLLSGKDGDQPLWERPAVTFAPLPPIDETSLVPWRERDDGEGSAEPPGDAPAP